MFWKCLRWSCLKAVSVPTSVTGGLRGSTATSPLVQCPLPSPGTITRYTQGVLVGASNRPLANILKLPTLRLQLSHRHPRMRSRQPIHQFFPRSPRTFRFFSFSKTIIRHFISTFTMVIKRFRELRGESAAFGDQSASSMSKYSPTLTLTSEMFPFNLGRNPSCSACRSM